MLVSTCDVFCSGFPLIKEALRKDGLSEIRRPSHATHNNGKNYKTYVRSPSTKFTIYKVPSIGVSQEFQGLLGETTLSLEFMACDRYIEGIIIWKVSGGNNKCSKILNGAFFLKQGKGQELKYIFTCL